MPEYNLVPSNVSQVQLVDTVIITIHATIIVPHTSQPQVVGGASVDILRIVTYSFCKRYTYQPYDTMRNSHGN
jgi:hypothetical protein